MKMFFTPWYKYATEKFFNEIILEVQPFQIIILAKWVFILFFNPKLTTFLGRIKMASEEIDPRPRKYWLSVESLKAYGQKTYWRQYYLSTLQRPLIPFTEGR